ncbi:hypothetical protein Pmani_016095 [Petrolisthes manimaculis]|uniref:Uncharacterized protein n=1 Tax=Petrolisthes manimaculis TaxID=1843537 RepID=A0AAE1PQV0_9EUCA|nr:hypothetical protein Pmani_016095 [Petrolisthes manimaculis]
MKLVKLACRRTPGTGVEHNTPLVNDKRSPERENNQRWVSIRPQKRKGTMGILPVYNPPLREHQNRRNSQQEEQEKEEEEE